MVISIKQREKSSKTVDLAGLAEYLMCMRADRISPDVRMHIASNLKLKDGQLSIVSDWENIAGHRY